MRQEFTEEIMTICFVLQKGGGGGRECVCIRNVEKAIGFMLYWEHDGT